MNTTQKLRLPKLLSISLRNFSLYSAEPEIAATIGPGVFCLAGANGLGKSTFLSALNFSMTGVVPEPGRTFQSVDEYYKHNLDFAKDYFDGRIDEKDREAAEVTVRLRVGDLIYDLTRGMFEPDELRQLTVSKLDSGEETIIQESSEETPRVRHQMYAARIATDIGLNSFQQFVFLQGFVFTFDERRDLLFWNEKVLDQVLYLAFGVDHAEAQRADALRREAERADSLARNHNWQATELRKKIEDLNAALGQRNDASDTSDIRLQHESLTEAEDHEYQRVQVAQADVSDSVLRLAELGAQYASLRSEYEAEFSHRMGALVDGEHHPVVSLSLTNERCEICGTSGEEVTHRIRKKLDENICPLCESATSSSTETPQDLTRLQEIDRLITVNREAITEASKRRQRMADELASRERAYSIARSNLTTFEMANADALRTLTSVTSSPDGNVDLALARYREQLSELISKKENQYNVRNEKRKALLTLQRRLVKQYQEAEETFVPSFRRLATSFLGIDLDIELIPKAPVGLSMKLEVRSMTRRQTHQLSESQRFFVDIALRMALIGHMCDPSTNVALLLDTPEGSLDIAYENRAGDMFAQFVDLGYGVIMTANINSSRLLLELAERCGKAAMKLCRMTSWTELSEVQIEEEALFEAAYTQIEKALLVLCPRDLC